MKNIFQFQQEMFCSESFRLFFANSFLLPLFSLFHNTNKNKNAAEEENRVKSSMKIVK